MSAWFLGLHPEREVLTASYAAEFASDKVGGPARDFFLRHGPRFFGVALDPANSARHRWKTSAGGGMTTVGVQQGVAGRGADLAIIDDPYASVEEAMSRKHRDKAWEWYQGEFVTRCSPGAPVIHIMSRWNVDDHMARAIEQAKEAKDRYLVLDFPALAICKECGSYGIEAVNECGHGLRDELGRLPGEALWPEVRPRDFLLKQRIRSARFFESLYQGRPRPDSGTIFKREWFRYYKVEDNRFYLLDAMGKVVQSYSRNICRLFIMVDLAAGTSTVEGDFTCFGVFALCPNHELVVLDWFRGRIDGTRQIPTLKVYWAKHKAGRIGVEAVAYQWTFVQQGVAEGLPIVPVKRGRESKETRAYVIAARYEMGHVFHPFDAPWVPALENELIDFPTGAFDDQVDVLSDAGDVVAQAMNQSDPQARGVYVG
jgi:predicted phage terminase large subunit-like protein